MSNLVIYKDLPTLDDKLPESYKIYLHTTAILGGDKKKVDKLVEYLQSIKKDLQCNPASSVKDWYPYSGKECLFYATDINSLFTGMENDVFRFWHNIFISKYFTMDTTRRLNISAINLDRYYGAVYNMFYYMYKVERSTRRQPNNSCITQKDFNDLINNLEENEWLFIDFWKQRIFSLTLKN